MAALPFVRALVFIVVALAGGCGSRATGTVSGTVTFRGKPVPAAVVTFLCPGGAASAGETDIDGRFTLATKRPGDGVAAGHHRVIVEPLVKLVDGLSPDPATPLIRPDIPQRYQTPGSTPLRIDVAAGTHNRIHFELVGD